MHTVHSITDRQDRRAWCGRIVTETMFVSTDKAATTCQRCKQSLRYTGVTPSEAAAANRAQQREKRAREAKFWNENH
jgi:hypothetical protein